MNMYFQAHQFSPYESITNNYIGQTDNTLAVTPRTAAVLYDYTYIYKTYVYMSNSVNFIILQSEKCNLMSVCRHI